MVDDGARHSQAVSSAARGIVPDLRTIDKDWPIVNDESLDGRSIEGLREQVVKQLANYIQNNSTTLEDLASEPSSVINMSYGVSPIELLDALLHNIDSLPEPVRKTFFIKTDDDLVDDLVLDLPAVEEFVDSVIQDPKFQEALKGFDNTVSKLKKEHDKIVVIAAGNGQHDQIRFQTLWQDTQASSTYSRASSTDSRLTQPLQFEPDESINLLGLAAKNAIVVTGANQDLNTDNITRSWFSSVGPRANFSATPKVKLPNGKKPEEGTSFAAPKVAAAAAALLNEGCSAEQTIGILEKNAAKTPTIEDGAGFLSDQVLQNVANNATSLCAK